jgi:hypothetical protein
MFGFCFEGSPVLIEKLLRSPGRRFHALGSNRDSSHIKSESLPASNSAAERNLPHRYQSKALDINANQSKTSIASSRSSITLIDAP